MRQDRTFTPSSTAEDPSGGHHPPARAPSAHRGRRRVGRSLAAGLLIAASFTVAACAKDGPKAATILNTEKVERAIEDSVAAQRSKKATVTCPSGVHQKKGLTFSCTATVKNVDSEFVVTQQDGAGRVRYAAR